MKTKQMLKVTFDGCGINDTDEYASRLATFTERGRPLGDAIVRAVNSHDALVECLKDLAYYCQDQIKDTALAERVSAAIAKAEGR